MPQHKTLFDNCGPAGVLGLDVAFAHVLLSGIVCKKNASDPVQVQGSGFRI